MSAAIYLLNNFRTRKTRVHPISLATVNKYNAKYPEDEGRHVEAFKIAHEWPNAPLAMADLVARMKSLHFF